MQPDSPAAAAGLKHGDVVAIGFNGTRIYHPVVLAEFIEAHPNEPVTLQVNRDGEADMLQVTVQPEQF